MGRITIFLPIKTSFSSMELDLEIPCPNMLLKSVVAVKSTINQPKDSLTELQSWPATLLHYLLWLAYVAIVKLYV